MNVMYGITELSKIRPLLTSARKKHDKYELLIRLGVETGLRVSDILALRVRDVKDVMNIIERKTKKKKKIILTIETMNYIENYIKRHRLSRTDYLIYSRDYKKYNQLSRVQAYRVLRKICKDNGISKFGTHGLRKTYAIELYKQTNNIIEVQKALNHKYPTTTMLYLLGDMANAKINFN